MSALGPLLVDAALRGSVVLLAALAATALMRRSPASARHLVWLAALGAVLVLPAVRQVVPAWRVLPELAVADAVPRSTTSLPVMEASAPASEPEVEVAYTSPEPASPDGRTPVDLPRLAFALWAAGAALLLLRLAGGVARVWWIERRAAEVDDGEWVRLADSLSRRLGLGRIVRLLRHDGARVPMTWGVLRPVVLLPAEADGWDDERRRVVLAHELAHVGRWDALTQWVGHLATALFWFHPLVWVAAHRLRQERERACDDAVLEIGTRPAVYAEHLLTLVRSLGRAPAPAAALAMARRSQYEGRMRAILDAAAARGGTSRAARLATAGGALAAVLALAAVAPADAAPVAEPDARADGGPDVAAPAEREMLEAPASAVTEPRSGASDGLDPVAEAAPRDTARARLVRALAAAGELGTDTEKRRAVLRVLADPAFASASDVPLVLLDVLRGMSSATDQRRILGSLWAVRQWDQSCLVTFLEHAGTLASDTERRRILASAAASQRLGDDARGAYLAAAQAIRDDGDRQAALAALPDAPAGRRAAASDRHPGETRWDSELVLTGTRDGRERKIILNARDMFYRSARSDPHRIGPGGELYVEEDWGGRVRILRGLPGADGSPRYTYTVNGVQRPFDDDARGWMSAIVRELTGG
jgi:beta-lactamase regulating signal transducer with metallopeptidase domain